jgi:dTDP-4-dehydrorhamnose 3,5-epimerase
MGDGRTDRLGATHRCSASEEAGTIASLMSDSSSVVGREVLIPKQSAVDENGRPVGGQIDGVIYRQVRPVPHEDGVLVEIARAEWPELDQPIVQVHMTTTLAGRKRAWGLHQRSTDRLFVVKGLISLVVYDGRLDSPTLGLVNEFKISERNPALVVIPPNLFHGWANIGIDEALIINMPSAQYDYEGPDALDLPYDSEQAPTIVPFRW